MKKFLILTMLIVSSISLPVLACEKYDTLIAGEYDNFLVGGKITRITDHRFQKSADKLDPLVAYIGFEELKVFGIIQPLLCKKIALVNTDTSLNPSEVSQLFDHFGNAIEKDLKIHGYLTKSVYGHAFRLSSPIIFEK